MMAAVDRFLTLMRVVPGCIAVQCGGGEEDGGGREDDEGRKLQGPEGHGADDEGSEGEDDSDGERDREDGGGRMGEGDAARLLVAAHLIRGRGFGAAEALAWAQMAHPAAAGPAPALVLLPAGRGGRRVRAEMTSEA
jgi:hypothetical protein